MTKLNFYLVSYDRLDYKSIESLDDCEKKCVKCYAIRKNIPKNITKEIDIINEWDLPWNDYSFQNKQYYEYGAIVHLTKNIEVINDLTHVGILHYDIIFNKNSINDIVHELSKTPNKIFYQKIRGHDELCLSKDDLNNICDFMSDRLNINIISDNIWKNGWISESLSVTPIEVFKKFGNFIINNRSDIEDILLLNKWGIMNTVNHRICGIVERMWGIYLVSLNLPLEKMNIEHDWYTYSHKHQTEENWIKK